MAQKLVDVIQWTIYGDGLAYWDSGHDGLWQKNTTSNPCMSTVYHVFVTHSIVAMGYGLKPS